MMIWVALCTSTRVQQKGHRSRPRRLVFLPPATSYFSWTTNCISFVFAVCILFVFLPIARYIKVRFIGIHHLSMFSGVWTKEVSNKYKLFPLKSKETNIPRVRIQIVFKGVFLERGKGQIVVDFNWDSHSVQWEGHWTYFITDLKGIRA